jgi:hypothetical protein
MTTHNLEIDELAARLLVASYGQAHDVPDGRLDRWRLEAVEDAYATAELFYAVAIDRRKLQRNRSADLSTGRLGKRSPEGV